MTSTDLKRLSGWLRCNPVAGMEDERKVLTCIVEHELIKKLKQIGSPVPSHLVAAHTHMYSAELSKSPEIKTL